MSIDGHRKLQDTCGQPQQDKDFIVHRVRHTSDLRFYEVEFSLSGRQPLIIYQFQLSDQYRTFAMTVPSTSQKVHFVLSLEVSRRDQIGDHISRVLLNHGETSEFPYGLLARAWNAYRQVNLSWATEILSDTFIQDVDTQFRDRVEEHIPWAFESMTPSDIQSVERSLRNKVDAPLGAAIAGSLLVEGHLWPRLHDWLKNVAGFFPWFTDDSVLWAEQLLRQYPADLERRREALEQLLSLEGRKLPLLTK